MPGHVPDESGKIWVLARFGQDGGIPGGHLTTALAFQCARDDLRPASGLLLNDQAVEERDGIIRQPHRNLSAHS